MSQGEVKRAILLFQREPRSVNARSRPKYQAELALQAQRTVAAPLRDARLYGKIYYLHRGRTAIDADNLSKPILDALREVVFLDDAQVVLRTAAIVSLDAGGIQLAPGSDVLEAIPDFIDLVATQAHLIYVEVGQLGEITLGLGADLGGRI